MKKEWILAIGSWILGMIGIFVVAYVSSLVIRLVFLLVRLATGSAS